MTTIEREKDIFDIDPSTFTHINLKNYIKTYFLEGSLNISSEVPILILDNIPIVNFSGGDFTICVSNQHPFYNIFRELSKDNKDLYNAYFKEEYSTSKIRDKITLSVNYDQKFKTKFLNESKMWCKLDIQVKISHFEGLLFEEDRDSEYINRWFFMLDLNKIEFV